MRIYGKHSGRNNIPKFLTRSYMFNKKHNRKEIKEKERTFLRKKTFEEFDDFDFVFYIIFIIVVIIIVLTSFN